MTPTPEEEREARAWLASLNIAIGYREQNHRDILLALLDRPVLPAEPTEEMLNVMCDAWRVAVVGVDHVQYNMYRALYAHLTKPKTREIEVWRVEYAGQSGMPFIDQHQTRAAADDCARKWIKDGARCVRVTGPHKQEVPAWPA